MLSIFSKSVFVILIITNIFANDDSIFIYDANKTGSWRKTIIPLPNANNTAGYAITESNVGQFGRKINVDTTIAFTSDTAYYSQMLVASSFFNLDDFPVRTNVKIFYYDHGNIRQHASGTLISPRHVLTAAHNIVYGNRWWGEDAFLIAPAYNNGHFSTVCDTVRATRYYFRFSGNSICCPVPNIDIGILELDRPIGYQIGWCGYGYDVNICSSMENKLMHCFSYPGKPTEDSSRIYNGDTMYYNYGRGTCSSYPTAAPGQSGSTLFYWVNNGVTVYGVRSTTSSFELINDYSTFNFISFVLSMPLKTNPQIVLQHANLSERTNLFAKVPIITDRRLPDYPEFRIFNLLGRRVDNRASNLYIMNIKNVRKRMYAQDKNAN